MKTCTKCKQEKPFTEFHKHVRQKDGLCTHCKACVKIARREYNSKPSVKARIRAYKKRPDVKERIRKQSREYLQRPEVKARTRKTQRAYAEKQKALKAAGITTTKRKPQPVQLDVHKEIKTKISADTIERMKEYKKRYKDTPVRDMGKPVML